MKYSYEKEQEDIIKYENSGCYSGKGRVKGNSK